MLGSEYMDGVSCLHLKDENWPNFEISIAPLVCVLIYKMFECRKRATPIRSAGNSRSQPPPPASLIILHHPISLLH